MIVPGQQPSPGDPRQKKLHVSIGLHLQTCRIYVPIEHSYIMSNVSVQAAFIEAEERLLLLCDPPAGSFDKDSPLKWVQRGYPFAISFCVHTNGEVS